MKRQPGEVEQFDVTVTERLAPYEFPRPLAIAAPDADADLVERAATLLVVMPPNQHRHTIEELLSPGDPSRGRRAVDALIDGAFAAEDELGRLRRVG